MKFITREVTMYKYIFANIDVSTGSAFNMTERYSATPMGQREIKSYCEANNNAVVIMKDEIAVKYSLPLDRFVKCCEEYAKEVAEGTAETPSEEDEEEIVTEEFDN